ncbi:phosphopantothenate-cysteine ligase /phosphopantothenoylcysteine decarboxylase [Methylosinus sp. sav-2]|uniref:bifunctional phosphopantothenoylcysteine decarboxylase/phosphopantothenate--cysteine ligase CoaBC n=1 Tax=Methylosinus sp. sav-2 TaxID=2485168 RepID=UPI00047D1245|nr:bifunctional phosphopantothenoylcysteine decarboxylase/phosphopantothenate--cysteine ligase CoaBC [Methylosinus sp. sav-2]TDX60265.1 phosphopantothenate-cysteine ligase /phosphopantothenoylcysteine decarboxylase [Methylosinus sp. sav-2]
MVSSDPQSLSGKRILLVVGGGVAAYKALELVRRLRERGAFVRVVLTAAAARFVTPLSFASLSGERVYEDLFSLTDEQEMGHIRLSREADLVVVAPATAHLLARMAQGLADDLATTLLLATDKRALLAPAMNLRMWLHPATQRNVATLRGDGALFVGPDDGEMACGEFGPGRMAEPLAIVAAIEAALRGDTVLPPPVAGQGRLAGRHVLVTSGPTREPIDPARFLSNRSSGKQGHAIAAAAAQAGARVTLVSGPVEIADPKGVATRHVETAQQMLEAVEAALPADVFIGAAAVADWRVEPSADKIKKGASREPPTLVLRENPDILASVAQRREGRPALVVGFAAETRDVLLHAQEKLARKGCDLIVANDVGAGVFGADSNEVHLVSRAGLASWPRLDKTEVAARLIAHIADTLGETP